jgi:hypothetical protein
MNIFKTVHTAYPYTYICSRGGVVRSVYGYRNQLEELIITVIFFKVFRVVNGFQDVCMRVINSKNLPYFQGVTSKLTHLHLLQRSENAWGFTSTLHAAAVL